VTFGDGINVLLGKNGTGKTTLLELAVAAHGSDFTGLEAFDLEYELVSLDERLLVRVQYDGEPPTFRFRIELNGPDGLVVAEQTADRILVDRNGVRTLDALSAPSVQPRSLFRTLPSEVFNFFGRFAIVAVSGNWRFDDSLGTFQLMRGITFQKWKLQSGNALLGVGWPEGQPLRSVSLMASLQRVDADESSPAIRDVAFLHRLCQVLNFKSSEARFRVSERVRVSPREEHVWFDDLRILFTRHDGSEVSDQKLSYGQKRLLSFLYYSDADSLIVADELVNGMHHDWIRTCIDQIGTRQAILTSQNPLLFDHLEFADPADASSRIIRCAVEVREGREWMTWSNMNHSDATSFFRSYSVGLQHVGEILLTMGLW
jgi:hypothetical protein